MIGFRSGQEEAAYAAIVELEPRNVYRWEPRDAIASEGVPVEANVLVGRSISHGAHRPDGPWQSRRDPVFDEAMALAEPGAIRGRLPSGGPPELRGFFIAQMQYLLLWTAIERFAALRWGFEGGPSKQIKRFAKNDASLARALLTIVPPEREEHVVYRADDPAKSERLVRSDPVKAIGYYYQVRPNVSHRGKSAHQEVILVETCLRELWRVFSRVLDETLGRLS